MDTLALWPTLAFVFGGRLGGRVVRDVKFWWIRKLWKNTNLFCFVFQKNHSLDIGYCSAPCTPGIPRDDEVGGSERSLCPCSSHSHLGDTDEYRCAMCDFFFSLKWFCGIFYILQNVLLGVYNSVIYRDFTRWCSLEHFHPPSGTPHAHVQFTSVPTSPSPLCLHHFAFSGHFI